MHFKRLLQAYNDSGLTQKQLAEKSQVSEKTISRMLTTPDYRPSIETTTRVTQALNITMLELYAETDVVLVRKDVLADLEETKRFVDECKALSTENVSLREELLELKKMNDDLKTELKHKDEIIAIHESYKVFLDGLARIITETGTARQ